MIMNLVVFALYLSVVALSTARCCSEPPTTPRPSRAPTIFPTRLPSEVPTRKPSRNPTPMPTRLPSIVPSRKPSRSPTTEPTENPTEEPTYEPSQPSSRPSGTPTTLTPRPTYRPSLYPTPLPTYTPQPSTEPTALPTITPSKSPSIVPSRSPTVAPTRSPSPAPPTIAPSTKPTKSPSNWPTMCPSCVPTTNPTEMPTISLQPSVAPSAVPSTEPTYSPTIVPSQVPSFVPSVKPSTVPTAAPTTTIAFALRMDISQELVNIDASTFQNTSANYDAFSMAVSKTVGSIEQTDVSVNTVTDTIIPSRRSLRGRFSPPQHTFTSLSATVPEINVEYTVSFVVQERGFVDATQASEYVQSQLRAAVSEGTFTANLASAAGNVSGADPSLLNVTAGALTFLRTEVTALRSAEPSSSPTQKPDVTAKSGGFSAWPEHLKAITIFFSVLGFILLLLMLMVVWSWGDSWDFVCLYCMVSGATLFHKDLCVMATNKPAAAAYDNNAVTAQLGRSSSAITTLEQPLDEFNRSETEWFDEPLGQDGNRSDPPISGSSSCTILPPVQVQNPPTLLGFISSALSHFLPFGPLDSEDSDGEESGLPTTGADNATRDGNAHESTSHRNSLDGSIGSEEEQWTVPGEILVDETELPDVQTASTTHPPPHLLALSHSTDKHSTQKQSELNSTNHARKPKKSNFQFMQSTLANLWHARRKETFNIPDVDVNLSDTYPTSSDGMVPMQSAPQQQQQQQSREPLHLELESSRRPGTHRQPPTQSSMKESNSIAGDTPAVPIQPRSILKPSAAVRESPRAATPSRIPRVAFRLSTPRASLDRRVPTPTTDAGADPAPATTPGGTLFAMVSAALALVMPLGAEEDAIPVDIEQDAPEAFPPPPPPPAATQPSDEFTERIMSSYRPASTASAGSVRKAGLKNSSNFFAQQGNASQIRTVAPSGVFLPPAALHSKASTTINKPMTEPLEESIVINLSSQPAKKSHFNPFRYFAHAGASAGDTPTETRQPSYSDSDLAGAPGELSTSTKEYISSLSGMHPSSRPASSAPWQLHRGRNTSLMQSTDDWQQPVAASHPTHTHAHHPPPPLPPPDQQSTQSKSSYLRGPSESATAPSAELRRQYAAAPPRISYTRPSNSNQRSPRRLPQSSVPLDGSDNTVKSGIRPASVGFSKPKSLPVKK